ncbi:hypothetical protein APB26_32225 [Pseudomonas aeruginosa]|uniref:hypothetical protein n=1 Tax=Pseudomonas aeruginosa TaxID=287 RepID=UPI00071B3440|nr:hypothetical protein [Pseudomonas aeruginosa]KSQ21653.1 hypothetical protein APB26_32225 [Pseudomonas aeruginosa]RPV61322.1 hypothetical protein IPC838_18555 [Pseudomonas aeruginosa]
MIRTATRAEVSKMEKQGYSGGWRDGLMSRECAPPYPSHSIQGRKYQDGHKAGLAHRDFLHSRGMRHVTTLVEKGHEGWRWTVVVEEELAAAGCERTRRAAEGMAETAAIESSFRRDA